MSYDFNDGIGRRGANIELPDPIRAAALAEITRRGIPGFDSVRQHCEDNPGRAFPSSLMANACRLVPQPPAIFRIAADDANPPPTPGTPGSWGWQRHPLPEPWWCLPDARLWACSAVIHAVRGYSGGGSAEDEAGILLDARMSRRLLVVRTLAPYVANWIDALTGVATKVTVSDGAFDRGRIPRVLPRWSAVQ